jgi:Ser/Thr protein kinase RdoA (MazF antagonist)
VVHSLGISKARSEEATARLELLRKYLERHYHVKISELKRLDRGVYRAERSEDESWVVRVFPETRALERALGDAEILNFLERNGFPAERCAVPESVTEPGGSGVMITKYVEGVQAEPNESNFFKYGELLAKLSQFHGVGAVAREAGSLHHYSNNEGAPRNEITSAISWLEEIKEQVPKKCESAFKSLSKELLTVDDLHDLPKGLIHPDPVLKNLIANKDGELVLIDWTGAGTAPRIASLAILIWSAAISERRISGERIRSVLAGYQSVAELQELEMERLSDAMRRRPLVFAAFRLRHAIRSGETPNGEEWWWPSDELVDQVASQARDAFTARS